MTIKGIIRDWLNYPLGRFNVRIDSLTADRAELARLLRSETLGQFIDPVFPIPSQFIKCDPRCLLMAVEKYKTHTRRFCNTGGSPGFSYANCYFTSPDAEVAYAIVRTFKPKRLIEVGSGNSTFLFRAAIEDSHLDTEIVSIDPFPREAIEMVSHRIFKERLEWIQLPEVFNALDTDDILFIDSSHQVRVGNDVVKLLLNIVPTLRKGVLIHFHDIFLPYEYPRQWLIDHRRDWNEQYLVQAMLYYSSSLFDVLWPGHYLQRTRPDFVDFFDVKPQGIATSLWLRKLSL